MNYHLLTGATGLLGAYLLHDAARREIPLALIVRPTRAASASQRIEDMYARWEKQQGRLLLRPVVLEGNLTAPRLGLSEADLAWVGSHCDTVIHNAASLTFFAQQPGGEPYLSNVEGTRNVLEVCRLTGIRRFHHVSTAYVAGLRMGLCLESELDVGQKLGNDYERSKLTSEKMVRDCDHLDSRTIFRPGIIIGDSRSGYTSTFHGFYVPLKVAHGLLQGVRGGDPPPIALLLEGLGVRPTDGKNFVPVDWVSAVMLHVIADPALHDRTYHLTPRTRTEIRIMAEVIRDVLDRAKLLKGKSSELDVFEHFQPMLLEQMDVYRSYWRDDPEFDCTNTLAAAPDLLCPEVNAELLRLTCEYAVRTNFGWPKPPQTVPPLNLGAQLAQLEFPPTEADESLALVVSGPGGGAWECQFRGGELSGVTAGVGPSPERTIFLGMPLLRELLSGQSSVAFALRSGRILPLCSSGEHHERCAELLSVVLARLCEVDPAQRPHRKAKVGLTSATAQ